MKRVLNNYKFDPPEYNRLACMNDKEKTFNYGRLIEKGIYKKKADERLGFIR